MIRSVFKVMFAVLLMFGGTSSFVVPFGAGRILSPSTTSRSIKMAGPATVEPEVKEKVKEDLTTKDKVKQDERVGGEAWEVRLWNDPFNKREFVARCLASVCGKTDGESFQIMMAAHKNGMGMIGRYAFEIAEMYTASLKGEGLMVDMIQVDDE